VKACCAQNIKLLVSGLHREAIVFPQLKPKILLGNTHYKTYSFDKNFRFLALPHSSREITLRITWWEAHTTVFQCMFAINVFVYM